MNERHTGEPINFGEKYPLGSKVRTLTEGPDSPSWTVYGFNPDNREYTLRRPSAAPGGFDMARFSEDQIVNREEVLSAPPSEQLQPTASAPEAPVPPIQEAPAAAEPAAAPLAETVVEPRRIEVVEPPAEPEPAPEPAAVPTESQPGPMPQALPEAEPQAAPEPQPPVEPEPEPEPTIPTGSEPTAAEQLPPDAAEIEQSPETEPGSAMGRIHKALVEAREADKEGDHAAYAKHLALLSSEIAQLAAEKGMSKENHLKLAEGFFAQLVSEETPPAEAPSESPLGGSGDATVNTGEAAPESKPHEIWKKHRPWYKEDAQRWKDKEEAKVQKFSTIEGYKEGDEVKILAIDGTYKTKVIKLIAEKDGRKLVYLTDKKEVEKKKERSKILYPSDQPEEEVVPEFSSPLGGEKWGDRLDGSEQTLTEEDFRAKIAAASLESAPQDTEAARRHLGAVFQAARRNLAFIRRPARREAGSSGGDEAVSHGNTAEEIKNLRIATARSLAGTAALVLQQIEEAERVIRRSRGE